MLHDMIKGMSTSFVIKLWEVRNDKVRIGGSKNAEEKFKMKHLSPYHQNLAFDFLYHRKSPKCLLIRADLFDIWTLHHPRTLDVMYLQIYHCPAVFEHSTSMCPAALANKNLKSLVSQEYLSCLILWSETSQGSCVPNTNCSLWT